MKHVVFTFYDNGVPAVVSTHMSHNNQDISDTLQMLMARQLRLTKSEFLDMISCKINHDLLAKRYAELGLLMKDSRE